MSHVSEDGSWGQDVTTVRAAARHLLDLDIITKKKKLNFINLHVSVSGADERVGIYLVSRIMHFAWQSSM